MVAILFAPWSFKMTANSVCTSTGAAAAAAPPPATATGAAARRRNAETLLELLHKGRRIQQAKPNQLIFQLLQIRHDSLHAT